MGYNFRTDKIFLMFSRGFNLPTPVLVCTPLEEDVYGVKWGEELYRAEWRVWSCKTFYNIFANVLFYM